MGSPEIQKKKAEKMLAWETLHTQQVQMTVF